MKFLKILKEYNQAIIKENQRLKRAYATLVRESEEDNENLDGEEQEFIEPPAEGNSEENDTEETTDGGNPDGGTAGSSDGEDGEEEGSQENESDDDIMQSGDEFYGEGGMNEGLGGALLGAGLGVGAAIASGSGALGDWGKDKAPELSPDQSAQLKTATDAVGTAQKAVNDFNTGDYDRAGFDASNDYNKAFNAKQTELQNNLNKATKDLETLKAGLPKGQKAGDFAKFARNVVDNPYAMGAIGGVAGHLATKDDKESVAETEQPTMTAEEFFGESDTDGWQTPKEFYGEAEEEPPIPDDDFFGEGEDHGALTEKGSPTPMPTDGDELMSAQDFLAGDENLEEGLGAAAGAVGGAALGAYGASHLKDALPDGAVADAIANPATGAALGAGGGYIAGKALDRDETDESEDDELMLAEDFFSDDAEDDEEMIPESDFFAEAAAMKA